MSGPPPEPGVDAARRSANPIAPRVRVPKSRALARGRVDALCDEVWNHKLTLVVAAAGCGKTTALAQLVGRISDPVAWYRADVSDASVPRFLECVATALAPILPGFPTRWDDAVEMALAVEAASPSRASLLVDDLHTVRGTPAESAFAELLVHLPPTFHIAVATRCQPDIDLSPLLLAGDVFHITSDDLRFRTWETEALFGELYNLRIPPEELARLTRRVRGWPAGLRLYQLAARGKTAIEQRRLVDVLSTRSWPMRDYLTRNILDTLRPELREFLINTSVLGVVTPQLSDKLLDRSDSDALLCELETLDLLTTPLDDTGPAFHCHEVLRAHLEARLLDRDEPAGRRHLVRAGELLEAHGWHAEALRCFGRAEAWEAVARIVGAGPPTVGAPWGWLDTLPPALIAGDPWLLLSRARARVSAGKLADGLASYRELEQTADIPGLLDACRRERLMLATWLEARPVTGDDWHGRLRQATQRDPLRAFDQVRASDPGMALGAGVAALIAGDLTQATNMLAEAAAHREAEASLLAGAQLAFAIASILSSGSTEAYQVDLAEQAAERVEIGWFARVARAALALCDRSAAADPDESVAAMCDRDGDEWGAALALLLSGWRAAKVGAADHGALAAATARFTKLNAPVLAAWSQALHAFVLARAGDPHATAMVAMAERHARALQVTGARAIAMCASDWINGTPGLHGGPLLRACGLDPAGFGEPRGAPVADPAPRAAQPTICLFGSFELADFAATVDLRPLRPRARSLLRLLALNRGKLIHREAIIDALWPNADLETGKRNLHTAISAVRQVLGSTGYTIERESDSYRFATPTDAAWDIAEFDAALSAARQARADQRARDAYDNFVRALALYTADLLNEEGPSEWVVAHRDRYRNEAVNAAVSAAEIALDDARHADAVAMCERAITLDPYADQAWRLMTAAFEASGSHASAQRCRQSYAEMQQRLGIVSSAPEDIPQLAVRQFGPVPSSAVT